jgi:hypothetical protein
MASSFKILDLQNYPNVNVAAEPGYNQNRKGTEISSGIPT